MSILPLNSNQQVRGIVLLLLITLLSSFCYFTLEYYYMSPLLNRLFPTQELMEVQIRIINYHLIIRIIAALVVGSLIFIKTSRKLLMIIGIILTCSTGLLVFVPPQYYWTSILTYYGLIEFGYFAILLSTLTLLSRKYLPKTAILPAILLAFVLVYYIGAFSRSFFPVFAYLLPTEFSPIVFMGTLYLIQIIIVILLPLKANKSTYSKDVIDQEDAPIIEPPQIKIMPGSHQLVYGLMLVLILFLSNFFGNHFAVYRMILSNQSAFQNILLVGSIISIISSLGLIILWLFKLKEKTTYWEAGFGIGLIILLMIHCILLSIQSQEATYWLFTYFNFFFFAIGSGFFALLLSRLFRSWTIQQISLFSGILYAFSVIFLFLVDNSIFLEANTVIIIEITAILLLLSFSIWLGITKLVKK